MVLYRIRNRLPQRILYVETAEDNTVGGSHQTLFDLVLGLDRTRYDPVVLFYQDNVFAQLLRDEGIEVLSFESHRTREKSEWNTGNWWQRVVARFTAVGRRARLITSQNIDLVHLNNSPRIGHTDWLPAARLARVPCIVTAVGLVLEPYSPIKRFLSRHFDRIITISKYLTQALGAEGVTTDLCTLVYPGVDAERLRSRVQRARSEVRQELGIAERTVLVVMVGNIRHWKGQHVVVEALSHIPQATLDKLHVIFVGAVAPVDAEYLATLKSAIQRAGLQHVTTFLGGRRDVPDLLNASDISVHASVVPEPFGLVVPEAMALGKPVIAASTGGPAEVLTPESGIVYDPSRPEDLARHLGELVVDSARRKILGRAALERVNAFGVQENVAGTERVYESIFKLSTCHEPS